MWNEINNIAKIKFLGGVEGNLGSPLIMLTKLYKNKYST